jgi:hypothetical protein
VLSGGATLSNKTLSNEQAQLDKLHDLSDLQISQLTDVPPHFLFHDSGGKQAPVQAGEDVVRYCFRPEIEQAEDELNKLLTPQEIAQGYTVNIDPTALLRGDGVEESTVVTALVAGGIISKNEGRGELGYPDSKDPSADNLATLGDTTPQALRPTALTPKAPKRPVKSSARTDSSEGFNAVFRPLLDDAAARVDAKTTKAFSARDGKPQDERTIWGNVFCNEQARYAAEALRPIATAIHAATGTTMDVAKIAERYSAAIRKRAADGTITTLTDIIEGMRNDN